MSVATRDRPSPAAGGGPTASNRQPPSSGSGSDRSSVFGDQISALAIPLTAVLALHASALEVGILTALAWLPHLLFSLPAGVWIDRRAHRRGNMIVATSSAAAALATIPVAWWLGALTMWHLLAVAFAVGALTVFFDLSSASFFVALVHRSQYVDANSKLSTTRSLSYIAGPSTAGLPRAGVHGAGRAARRRLSFVVSAVALRGVKVPSPSGAGTSARADLVDGFRYLARQPVLRGGVICTSIINFFSFFIFAIFVLYASRGLGLSAARSASSSGRPRSVLSPEPLIAPRVGVGSGSGAPSSSAPCSFRPRWRCSRSRTAGIGWPARCCSPASSSRASA